MAYVFRTYRKDGSPHPKWRITYTDWQGRRRTTTGKPSKKETEVMAARIEADHDEIRKGHRAPPNPAFQNRRRSVRDTVVEYLEWGRAQGGRRGRPWGKDHARKRTSHLNWWVERLELETIADLDHVLRHVERELRALKNAGRSGKTLENYAEAIRSFCTWCVDRSYLSVNPIEKLKRFDTTPNTTRRALLPQEIHALLEAAPIHRRLLYEVAFCTGLRKGELKALTPENVDVERCGLRLDAEWTKNRKPGFQPLPEVLVSRLLDFAESGLPQDLYVKFHRRCDSTIETPPHPLLYVPSHTARDLDVDLEAAGVPKITEEGKADFHGARVAYVSYVLQAGAGAKEAQSLARHATPDLTMNTYARTRSDRLSELADKVGNVVLPSEDDANAISAKRSNISRATRSNSTSCSKRAGGSTPPSLNPQLV